MTFIQFLRIFSRNLKWLIFFPLLVAVLVYFLTSKMPKEYQSGTSVYTGFASGYGITSGEEVQRVDYFAVNNAFDNLLATVKARQTLEDVAINLLAQHLLLEMPDPLYLSAESFERLKNEIDEPTRAKLIVPGNFSATVDRITKEKNSSTDNVVVKLLSDPKGHYSLQTLFNNLTAERKSTSDFLDISFKSSDPGVCLNTVKFVSLVFIEKYKFLKTSETVNVVKWFEARLKDAAAELNNSENKLKDFGIRNKIINYYEQAKAVAIENETNETEYYKELMTFESHKKAIARLEDQLESREILLKNNSELNRLRKQLADAHEEYERAKLYTNSEEKIAKLATKVDALKQELKVWVLQYYSINNTMESVPSAVVLENWLREVIGADASEARLQVYVDRRKEFDRKYNEFSPLNMQVGRLEREISVAEKQYLEILHGLHLAKLRQQNIEMSNNLQVMDSPIFPTKPLPSRRLLLIILSFLASFFLLLIYFIAKELLDGSIKNTTRAEELTGLKTFSALPNRGGLSSHSNIGKIENTLLDYGVTNLKIELENSPEKTANYLITIISSREMEGKTYAAQKLAEKLYSLDYSVLFLSNDDALDDAETEDRRFRMMRYDITSKFFNAKTEENLLPELSRVRKDAYNFIIVEIPAISVNALPNQLIKNSRLSLLVLDARRGWTASDDYILKLFSKASSSDNKIMTWLNHVEIENLENLVGSIPKSSKPVKRALKQEVIEEA
jgi:succinoglycan biosynthesis transport protein ExoP